MDQRITVGVLGATSPVGTQVLSQLAKKGINVIAFSRKPALLSDKTTRWVSLSDLNVSALESQLGTIPVWISASPIWVMPQHFELIAKLGGRRVVCVSSTSRFTKTTSSNPYEEQVVQKLVDGEHDLMNWAKPLGIDWTVLRPTLIYGRGNDRNLSEIIKIIKKFGFFPLFGKAEGLRQPIYVDDVAAACVQAAFSANAADKAYNISGAEQLSYKEMVSRVFTAMGRKPRLFTINLTIFNCALFFLTKIPRYKNWNADMVLRMNRDMVFDHDEAGRDFGFNPKRFHLTDQDVKQ